MARRERVASEIIESKDGELTPEAVAALAKTEEGQTVLLLREHRETAQSVVAAAEKVAGLYKEALEFYQKGIFHDLASLAGSLAANARAANESLCAANAKLAEAGSNSLGSMVMDFVRENPETVQAILAPVMALAAQTAARKLGIDGQGEAAGSEGPQSEAPGPALPGR